MNFIAFCECDTASVSRDFPQRLALRSCGSSANQSFPHHLVLLATKGEFVFECLHHILHRIQPPHDFLLDGTRRKGAGNGSKSRFPKSWDASAFLALHQHRLVLLQAMPKISVTATGNGLFKHKAMRSGPEWHVHVIDESGRSSALTHRDSIGRKVALRPISRSFNASIDDRIGASFQKPFSIQLNTFSNGTTLSKWFAWNIVGAQLAEKFLNRAHEFSSSPIAAAAMASASARSASTRAAAALISALSAARSTSSRVSSGST